MPEQATLEETSFPLTSIIDEKDLDNSIGLALCDTVKHLQHSLPVHTIMRWHITLHDSGMYTFSGMVTM